MTKEELLNIKGGEINITIAGLIAAAVTLIAGIIDGIVNPISCND